jgi:hypothetical protein
VSWNKPNFFGPLGRIPAAYLRGGAANGTGTLGKSFAYKRPQFDDGGAVDDSNPYGDPVDQINQVFAQQRQQQRQPGQVEGTMKALNQWGQGPSGYGQGSSSRHGPIFEATGTRRQCLTARG